MLVAEEMTVWTGTTYQTKHTNIEETSYSYLEDHGRKKNKGKFWYVYHKWKTIQHIVLTHKWVPKSYNYTKWSETKEN
jgi:hypothetical protein